MSPLEPIMPVDRSTIVTTVRVSPDLLKDPKQFAHRRDIPLRGYKFINVPGKKFGRFRRALVLHLLKFRGAQVTVIQIGRSGMSEILINFNPGVILYGHNGRILRETEFCEAIFFVTNTLRKLLDDPEDWWRLVPGLHPDSSAYWSYLEIPLHSNDPAGQILNAFRNARHPSIRKPALHWNTSMLLPGCNLKLSVYRKGIEMASRKKLSDAEIERFKDILRLEIRLRSGKLVDYLGSSENCSGIGETTRIVRFRGSDLIQVLRRILGEIQGVFQDSDAERSSTPSGQLESLGGFIADMSREPGCNQTFHEQLARMCVHYGVSGDTKRQLRKAGLAWLSTESPLAQSDIFADTAMISQPHVIAETLERMTRYAPPAGPIFDAIRRVYSEPSERFYPHTELPTYY